MIRLPPRSTRTDTLFPYLTLFRSCPPPFDPLPCPMPLIAKAKRHDGMGSALHSRAPRKLAGRWQLPPHPFYRTQPVKSAAYNERLGPRVAGGGSCHRGNTKRLEERGVGKAWVSACRYRWSQ